MSLPPPKFSFFLILVPLIFPLECIAQSLDVFTVSNFLPRPSLTSTSSDNRTPANTTTPAQPVPPTSIVIANSGTTSIPISQSNSSDVSITPLRLLPLPNAPPISRCNAKNTHSHPKTHRLLSQCRENTFCSSSGSTNGTCVPILCRRDEFPFGFGFGGDSTGVLNPNVELNGLNLPIPVPTSKKRKSKKDRPKDLTTTMVLPPLCVSGSFCPDDGSGCRQQNAVDGSCELGRDEQCAGDLIDIKSTTPTAVTQVPICLHLTCMYANATLDQPCIIENTTYVTDLHTGARHGGGETAYITTVIKHNCRSPGLFCDPEVAGVTGPICQPTKELKENCRFDTECASGNCAPDARNGNINVCAEPVGTPLRITPLQWGATGFCITGALVGFTAFLTFVHRRNRHEHYKELREYHQEQMSLRRSILALHAAAAERYSNEKSFEKI